MKSVKRLANQNQNCIKRIKHNDQVGFISGIQGWFIISISMNAIHYIRVKKKCHMLISIDADKVSNKIQCSFIKNTHTCTQQTRNRRKFSI